MRLACRMGVMLVAAGSIAVLLPGSSTADEIDRRFQQIARVGPGGQGSMVAREARDRLAREGVALLPRLLVAMDTDNIVAANWYRTIYEEIIGRALSRDPVPRLPVPFLKKYVVDPTRHGRVRRLVLALLDRLEPGYSESLIPSLLDDPEFRDEAVSVALQRGEAALKAGQKKIAQQAFELAFRAARDPGQVGTAADRLKATGRDVSVVVQLGFVIDWYFLGPFDAPGTSGFDLVLPPEKQVNNGIDLTATYEGQGGGRIGWKRFRTDDRFGQTNLISAIAAVKEAVGYAYTEFDSPRDQRVQLRCGADDNITIWINGRQVLRRLQWLNGTRLDRFRVDVSLRKGRNRMLVKVCQGPQHKNPAVPNNWSLQLRFCDPAGGGVPLKSVLPPIAAKKESTR